MTFSELLYVGGSTFKTKKADAQIVALATMPSRKYGCQRLLFTFEEELLKSVRDLVIEKPTIQGKRKQKHRRG